MFTKQMTVEQFDRLFPTATASLAMWRRPGREEAGAVEEIE